MTTTNARSARIVLCGLSLLGVLLLPAAAGAHDAARHTKVAPELPIEAGGPFALVDHSGKAVTDADYHGGFLLVFFGYANCPGICPTGLRNMTTALDLLGESGARVTPLLVTVDPATDNPETLAPAVAAIHPRLIGLTGSLDAIKDMSMKGLMIGNKDNPVDHSSYFVLVDAQCRVRGYYDGMDEEAVGRLRIDVDQLLSASTGSLQGDQD